MVSFYEAMKKMHKRGTGRHESLESDTNKTTNALKDTLEDNLLLIDTGLGNSTDLVIRKFKITANRRPCRIAIVYLDGLANPQALLNSLLGRDNEARKDLEHPRRDQSPAAPAGLRVEHRRHARRIRPRYAVPCGPLGRYGHLGGRVRRRNRRRYPRFYRQGRDRAIVANRGARTPRRILRNHAHEYRPYSTEDQGSQPMDGNEADRRRDQNGRRAHVHQRDRQR